MIDGKTLGVDATTLEANAALRSIVRRDTGESYESYLKELARKSGIEEPSRADIAKLDKKRPKKGSNKEWVNPNEPDAEIMKMKSGGTDMAHKAEHAVDMSGEGAVIAVTLHGGADVNAGGIKGPIEVVVLENIKGDAVARQLDSDELSEHLNNVRDLEKYISQYPSRRDEAAVEVPKIERPNE